MKKKIVSIVSLLTAIIMGTGIIACGDDDGIDNQSINEENIVLELKGLSSAFSSQPGSIQTAQLMEVTCNTFWTISSMPLWIDVDASGGNGNKSVRVWTTDENTSGAQRSGIIIVKAGKIEKSIEVKQNPIGDDDDVEVFVPVSARTLVVTLTGNGASAASVKYAGITGVRTGNSVTFENAPVSGDITVMGGTIIPQTTNIDFGDHNTLVIEINAVLASTNIVPQAAAESGTDVTNDPNNQTNTGVSANLNLGTNGSVPSYIGSEHYSLTVMTPAAAPEATLTPNASYTRALYSVVCKPDGASFTPAAHLDMVVDGAGEIGDDGIQFRFMNTAEEALNKSVTGNKVSGDLPHFSTWNIFVTATCISITEGQEEIARGSIVSGENTVTYNQKFGFSSSEHGIIASWLKLIFGAPLTQVAKTTKFNSNSAGSYVITQKTFTATFKAGNKMFQAKYYGDVIAKGK